MQAVRSFRLERSGDEPLHARSLLRLRLGLAGFGMISALVGVVLFAVVGSAVFVVQFAVIAVIAAVNVAVVVRHIRQGSRFQPGPEVPPYRPVHPSVSAPPPIPAAARTRHARYAVAMGAALVLLANAWTWVWNYSMAWAVLLSALAAALILAGVIATSADSPILRPSRLEAQLSPPETRPGRTPGPRARLAQPAAGKRDVSRRRHTGRDAGLPR